MVSHIPKHYWPVMQYGALAFELLVPLLFIVKPLRKIGFLWGFSFQMLIAATMNKLMLFSAQMLCFYVLFMEPKTLHWFRRELGRFFQTPLKQAT